MRGVAQVFGVPFPNEHTDVGAIGIDADLPPRPGCSVVYYPPQTTANGHGILSRNYDFSTKSFAEIIGLPAPPGAVSMTAHPYLMEVYPDRGYPALYMCAYDLLGGCIDGINAQGLTVALMADDETINTFPIEPVGGVAVGLNEIQILRLLLDTCACVEDAKQTLLATKQYYSFVPCHYLIGDRHGQSFAWEFSRTRNQEHIVDGGGKPQVCTNHLLHRYKSIDDLPHEEAKFSSYARYRTLHALLARQSTYSLDDIKTTNACVAMSSDTIPHAEAKPTRTLWHAVYDTHANSVEIDYYLGEDPSSKTRGEKRSGYIRFRLR